MRDPEYEDRFFELIHRAEAAEYAPDTGVWLEEAFRRADEQNDPEYGLLARYFYVFAVAPIEPHNAVVAFTWVTAHEEHASPIIPMHWIVHLYGLVGGILRSYPDYSLQQIGQTFDRMEEKFRELGMPMRDVWHHRVYEALGTGNRDVARGWFSRWETAEVPTTACRVCDMGTRVIYHLYYEDYDRAFIWAKPIWDGLRCNEGQPLMTASASLVPLLRLGRDELAEQCFRMSVAELNTISYAGIWAAGRQLGYLVSVGDLDDAIDNFNRYFTTAWSSGTPADRFGYLISARLLGERMLEEGRSAELRVPTSCGLHRDDSVYAPEHVVSWFADEIASLGGRFDARNGNGEFMRVAALTTDIYHEVRDRVR